MIKTLNTVGNSQCLIIDKPILEMLQIDVDTPLKLQTDDKNLIIVPQRNFLKSKVGKKRDV